MTITRTSALKQGYCGESGSTLPIGLQFPEHVSDEFVDLVLIERIAMYRLPTGRAIRQPLRRLLHEVKDDRAFAEANIFVADYRRPPAPRFPASIRAANKTGVSAQVHTLHGHVVPPYSDVIVHEEIRSLRVADLPQSLGQQCLLDCRADALANDFVVGAGFARDGFSARDHVPRYNRTSVRVPGWRDRLPGPGAPLGYGDF